MFNVLAFSIGTFSVPITRLYMSFLITFPIVRGMQIGENGGSFLTRYGGPKRSIGKWFLRCG